MLKATICTNCKNLQSELEAKETKIKILKSHIQNMSNFMLLKDSNEAFESEDLVNVNNSGIKIPQFYFSDLFFKSCDILESSVLMKSKSVQTENSGNCSVPENTPEVNNKVSESSIGNLQDYTFDEKYQMYYSSSTGYYYDQKSGLMYEPQSGTYYKYSYEKNEYEIFNFENKTNEPVDEDKTSNYICESVVEQVNNLNLNDKSTSETNSNGKVAESEISEISLPDDENESSSGDYKQTNEDDNVTLGCSKDWQPAKGSKLTIADIVKEVVTENDNMSDYVYDETHQMYYSPSTGYFFDSVRNLLYDPVTGIYYFYDTDKQTYSFYYQIQPNTIDKNNTGVNKNCIDSKRLERRKRFWKKKLQSQDNQETLKSDEEDNNLDMSGDFSSPEDGEIFSSDDESDHQISIVRSPVKGPSTKSKNQEDLFPPSIRAIVENSEKLQIGSLILITYSGGILGRDKMNAVCLPDISVSKMHAEIKFDANFQQYIIEDLGSQNGTFVNEKRLSEPKMKSEPCVLKHGDKLALGSCKLLLHMHEGYETCDNCEPGQVLAEISSQAENTPAFISKEEKEKLRRDELRKLKKKYGLQSSNFEKNTKCVPAKGYEDKAETRRQTVGSDNPYEKTVEGSLDVFMSETNKGYQMLKKMGWREGQTLGATDSGLVEPVPLRPWTSKAGLGSSLESSTNVTEDKRKKKWVKAQERYFQLSLKTETS